MNKNPADAYLKRLHETISQNYQLAPTEPGVYVLPCGKCIVDFFVTQDGQEHWLVPGEDLAYTRQTINLARHGNEPWRRLYTLEDAATAISGIAGSRDLAVTQVVEELAAVAPHNDQPSAPSQA